MTKYKNEGDYEELPQTAPAQTSLHGGQGAEAPQPGGPKSERDCGERHDDSDRDEKDADGVVGNEHVISSDLDPVEQFSKIERVFGVRTEGMDGVQGEGNGEQRLEKKVERIGEHESEKGAPPSVGRQQPHCSDVFFREQPQRPGVFSRKHRTRTASF